MMWERAWRATGRRTVAGTRISPPYFAPVSKHWCKGEKKPSDRRIREHIGKMARKRQMRCCHDGVHVYKSDDILCFDCLISTLSEFSLLSL